MERPKVFVVEPRPLNSDQRPMILNYVNNYFL